MVSCLLAELAVMRADLARRTADNVKEIQEDLRTAMNKLHLRKASNTAASSPLLCKRRGPLRRIR